MKKATTLVLAAVLSLGLVACSKNQNDHDQGNGYRGEILFSSYEGEKLNLTIRKNDCERPDGPIENIQVLHQYDSTLVVGACVRVTDNGDGLKNISTFSPRSPL
ncbi:hypothetical protein [Pasteurella sp. PK-2025]|uniref:hypothetical protein n=1 Tax=unclassified Pasteurella TaxID=2621516 RepID=UPI003C75D5D1